MRRKWNQLPLYRDPELVAQCVSAVALLSVAAAVLAVAKAVR